ncbi:MAG: hypothetical protein HRU19_02610 [Pseudobacteriovorax sp.]|nr:hypothetical protein [Pseudobacteriovorax sp.]
MNAYQSFFSQHPSYDEEIRIVGHSLGAQVASYATYRLHTESFTGPKPARLELIDPFIGTDIADTGVLPTNLNYVIPAPQYNPGSICGNYNNDTVYCVIENSLTILKDQHDVGIAIYGAASAGAFAYDLRKYFHYQSFSSNWLCSEFFWSGNPVCTVRNFSVFTAQHFFPLLSYFWSIDEAGPVGGYNANTATATFLGPNKWLRQKEKGNFCNLQHGYKFWEEGGLDHVFGVSRYPDSGFNDGYQVIAWSKEEFARRLSANLGFSSWHANQCAKAISFENDTFYEVYTY